MENMVLDYVSIIRMQNQVIIDKIDRLREEITNLTITTEANQLMIYIAIGIGAIAVIIGIAILWNQQKIKKQLRQLLEEREEITSSADKKNPE